MGPMELKRNKFCAKLLDLVLRNRLKPPGEPERFRFFGQIRLIFGCIAGGSVPKNSRNMPGKDAAFGPAGVFRRFLIQISNFVAK